MLLIETAKACAQLLDSLEPPPPTTFSAIYSSTTSLCALYWRREGRRNMARATAPLPPAFRESLLATFAVNDRINQLLIERLSPHAWRAPPAPRARTIAAIFAHMHNIHQLRRDDCGIVQPRLGSRPAIPPRRLGQTLPWRRRHGRLHAGPRSTPSWSDLHACSSNGIPFANEGHV